MGSNILGSIYTTTISSEKYIIINSQNIELSGNVIMKKQVTISNGLLNTNSLIPNVTNSESLGSSNNRWSNAYINDVSINNNLQVTGNVYISGNLEASNIYTKSTIDASFGDVYTIDHIDTSFQNVYTIDEFDNSFGNVYTIGHIDQSFANVYTISHIDTSFQNVYTRIHIDNSFANVYTSDHIDNSFQNVYNIEHIDTSFQNVYTRIQFDNSFTKVYTIGQFDNSYANVYTRGHIDNSYANVYTRIQVYNSFVTKRVVELSLNALPASSGGGGSSSSIVLTSISNDLIPLTTNTYNLGSTSKFWNNAYINNLRASNRVYQDINSGPLYEINNTLQTWEWHRTNALTVPGRSLASISNVEQNEKVRLMVSRDTWLGGKRKVYNTNDKTSSTWEWSNGTLWTYYNWDTNEPGSLEDNVKIQTTGFWHDYYNNPPWSADGPAVYMSYGGNDISWSAVNGYYGLAKDAYPSLNPLSSGDKAVQIWRSRTPETTVGTSDWISVCWSPELGIFVAVAYFGTNRVMTSPDGINWTARTAATASTWYSVCWSPELRLFVAVAEGGTSTRVMTSPDGISWTARTAASETNRWAAVCWAAELGIFVVVSIDGTTRVMISNNGITWSSSNISGVEANIWIEVCWSKELRLFVAVSENGTNRVMTSPNGTTWTPRLAAGKQDNVWRSVCWSPELGIFVAVSDSGSNRVMTSNNGINWISRSAVGVNLWYHVTWSPQLELFIAVGINCLMSSPDGINWTSRPVAQSNNWIGLCWSPEQGIAVAVSNNGSNRVMTSSLKGRPPTSYNVFDSTFNSIDETGKWTFQNMAVTTLNVTGSFTNSSDDRLKHNEVVIANGLDVIDRLTPKFYQKTQTLLDASYNGDLSGHAWTYEAGLIAQEVLQIPDLSFAVSGGDYYQESYILKNQSNDLSNVNYDPCGNYYDISANYDISNANYYDMSANYDISNANYYDMSANYDISNANYYDMSANYDISTNYINRANYYDTSANYDISYNLIARPYSLNYTSIYVYVFAAIKELHAKVKAQETAILNRQAIINNCITRIETLEQRNQV
jgi:ASC-1-like (ASCH) protein